MRNFITILVIAVACYFGYRAFSDGGGTTPNPLENSDHELVGRTGPGEGDPTDTITSGGILGERNELNLGNGNLADSELDEATLREANAKLGEDATTPAKGEIETLEKSLRDSSPPQMDEERLRLATLYRRANRSADADEHFELIYRGRGPLAAKAAAALLERASGEAQIEYAAFVIDHGPEAAGYGVAALIQGKELAEKSEEAAQMKAWRLLSDAYFSRSEESWRAPIRNILEPIANRWFLSVRPCSLTSSYTVQSGDYLARIADEHKTTVDQLRALNGIEGDLIHEGDRFKILNREITVVVDKSEFRLDVRYDGGYLMSFPVGHGSEGRTPTTTFEVNLRQEHPTWFPANRPSVPYGDPGNPLGERWLGFAAADGFKGFGIHGTNQPSTIGTEASEGCVRLQNEHVIRLYPYISLGTKVTILE